MVFERLASCPSLGTISETSVVVYIIKSIAIITKFVVNSNKTLFFSLIWKNENKILCK